MNSRHGRDSDIAGTLGTREIVNSEPLRVS
jgi:hypothetical protein